MGGGGGGEAAAAAAEATAAEAIGGGGNFGGGGGGRDRGYVIGGYGGGGGGYGGGGGGSRGVAVAVAVAVDGNGGSLTDDTRRTMYISDNGIRLKKQISILDQVQRGRKERPEKKAERPTCAFFSLFQLSCVSTVQYCTGTVVL